MGEGTGEAKAPSPAQCEPDVAGIATERNEDAAAVASREAAQSLVGRVLLPFHYAVQSQPHQLAVIYRTLSWARLMAGCFHQNGPKAALSGTISDDLMCSMSLAF